MIIYKTDDEIELIRESCLLVSKTLALVGSMIKPGMSGAQIDKAAEELILDHGAVPGFKGYGGFPATLCVSPNEQVVHGIPGKDQVFKDGDIVSVDCGVIMNGFYGDAAYTFALGDVSEEVMKLLEVTNTSLYKGIEQAVVGNRLGDVSFAVQYYAEKEHGYGIVRELVGHGVGRNLHEAPEVPNYGRRGRGVKLQEGLVIAIEPMVNLGDKRVATSKDGWTVYARDKKPSAHFEHTIAIRKDKADILSDHSIVEQAIRKNDNVKEVKIDFEFV
ncbi:MAG: type I methionyl aminopeptidase [Saprospiraceae bacterium]|nr:type I methionyl aminopeptidase [Saprospiraceae bacterium]MCB9323799.1 type I methionyl aminopeptidase [Lewinellaceae bacterium]